MRVKRNSKCFSREIKLNLGVLFRYRNSRFNNIVKRDVITLILYNLLILIKMKFIAQMFIVNDFNKEEKHFFNSN